MFHLADPLGHAERAGAEDLAVVELLEGLAVALVARHLPMLAAAAAEGDLPLGNFFQRYLYNAFGSITFLVPSSRANYRYFRWLLANEPRLLLRVTLGHARFLVQLLPPEHGIEPLNGGDVHLAILRNKRGA